MHVSTKFLIVAVLAGAVSVCVSLSNTMEGLAHAVAGSALCLFLITFIFRGAFEDYEASGESAAGRSH